MNRTPEKDESGGMRQNVVRNLWKKLIECEERLTFWKRMIEWGVGVRELEHIGEDIKEKFRSENMRENKSEREVIMLIMSLKMRDERKHQKELKARRNQQKELWKLELDSVRQYTRLLSKLNQEARKYRKQEKRKYINKAAHLKRIRMEEEERQLQECPDEIKFYEDCIIFNKERFNAIVVLDSEFVGFDI